MMDSEFRERIQIEGFVHLAEPKDFRAFDRDEISGMVEFPIRKIDFGEAQLMLHQQYLKRQAAIGSYFIEVGHEPDEPVLVLDEMGVSRTTYEEAEKLNLFALNLAVITSEARDYDVDITVLNEETGATIKGRMFKRPYPEDKTLFNEPLTWIAYRNNIKNAEEPVAVGLLMVPYDIVFLSSLGFKFEKIEGGGEVN